MTRYEELQIELDIISTIAFAEGNTFDEKIFNALAILRGEIKREIEKNENKY